MIGFNDVHRQGKNRVLVEALGLLHPLFQAGLVCEDGLFESLGYPSREVAVVILADLKDLRRHQVSGDVFVEQSQQCGGHILIQSHVVVFEEGVHLGLHLLGSSLDISLVGLVLKHLVDAHEPAAEGNGLASVPAGFAVIHERLLNLVQNLPLLLNAIEDVAVFGFPGRIGVDPVLEVLLLGETTFIHMVAFELLHLADIIFPIVRHAGLLGGIFDEHLLVGVHVLAVVVELGGAAVDDGGAFLFDDVFHGIRSGVAVGGAGITKNHGIIAGFHAVQVNGQIPLRLHRDVVGGILGRIAILVDIYTENVEVALMARPGPVVGVGAELADAPRRAAHQTHVLIFDILELDVLVAAVEGHDLHLVERLGLVTFGEILDVFLDQFLTLGFGHLVGYPV